MISAIGPSLDGIGLHFTRDLLPKMPGQRWIVRPLELQTDRRTMAQGLPAECEGPAEQRNGLSAFRLDDPKATVDVTREYEFALGVDVHSHTSGTSGRTRAGPPSRAARTGPASSGGAGCTRIADTRTLTPLAGHVCPAQTPTYANRRAPRRGR